MVDLNITISPEALEAAARELYEQERGALFVGRTLPSWEDASLPTKRRLHNAARAACLAMLKNWEGMEVGWVGKNNELNFNIILPLTQEPTDE